MRWLVTNIFKLGIFILILPFRVLLQLLALTFAKRRGSAAGYRFKKSQNGRYTYEHRQIAERVLKRKLRAGEVVHHINGIKRDNRTENLCVLSRTQHDRYHAWYDSTRKTAGKYPTRAVQLKKLRGTFAGIILSEGDVRKSFTG